MNPRRWLELAKWGWLVLVFGGVIYYFLGHSTSVLGHLRQFSADSLIFSVLSLVAAKFLLTYLSLWSMDGQEWRPTFGKMFYFNAVTQLAKYLPGGIWHFVGRYGLYRANGMTNTQSGRSILAENLWLVLSAACFGALASLLGRQLRPPHWPGIPDALIHWALPGLAAVIWIAGLLGIERFVKLVPRLQPLNLLRLLVIQAAIWTLIGIGFWVLIPGDRIGKLVGVSLGGFALSWAAGFLVPFAPSGLGVREAALTALLSPHVTTEGLAVYAAVNRLIWIVTELALGLLSGPLSGTGTLVAGTRRDHPVPSDPNG